MTIARLIGGASLADHPELSEAVKNDMKLADWQVFIVAMTVLVGGGLILISPTITNDVKLLDAGFVGAVVSYFFGRQQTLASAAATVAAQQTNGTKPGA